MIIWYNHVPNHVDLANELKIKSYVGFPPTFK